MSFGLQVKFAGVARAIVNDDRFPQGMHSGILYRPLNAFVLHGMFACLGDYKV